MASDHSYAVQLISLCVGLVPSIMALAVIVAARIEQRRARRRGAAEN